jgi:Sec-independent protein translocase protein TatA
MFSIGGGEIITILIIAIVFLNPKDWPKLVRIIGNWYGKWLRFYHAIMNDFQDAIDADIQETPAKESEDIPNQVARSAKKQTSSNKKASL